MRRMRASTWSLSGQSWPRCQVTSGLRCFVEHQGPGSGLLPRSPQTSAAQFESGDVLLHCRVTTIYNNASKMHKTCSTKIVENQQLLMFCVVVDFVNKKRTKRLPHTVLDTCNQKNNLMNVCALNSCYEYISVMVEDSVRGSFVHSVCLECEIRLRAALHY